jgi:DNA-binding NtrC family response regulator
MAMAKDRSKPCVVVVEDEVLIRMVAIDVLTEAGFIVLEAEHAAHALTHLEAKAADIDVLFTDVHMPGEMDGVDLAHHAQRHWPWITALITSGRGGLAALPAGSRFIPKPYDFDNVVAHVRELAAFGR